jgi:hypothetical protein
MGRPTASSGAFIIEDRVMKAKRHFIALYLPQVVALLIIFGRYVVQKMTGNTWFPSPLPPLPTVSNHLDQLEAAEATARGGGKGAAAARDVARKVVEDDLKGLKAYVYTIVALNVAQASAIIESAGMAERPFTAHIKAVLAAFPGLNLGEILVAARAAKRGSAYEWQVSTDGGVTWVAMGITTVANTHLLGATVGTTYTFRFRTTRKATTTAWSDVVHLTLH